MGKIFRLTKVTKFSDGDENFVQRKFLSDIVLSDKVLLNQIETVSKINPFRRFVRNVIKQ